MMIIVCRVIRILGAEYGRDAMTVANAVGGPAVAAADGLAPNRKQPASLEFLWYIPNQVTPGHRGDAVTVDHNSLETLSAQAKALEDHGWKGALIGTGWGRPDTVTVATALAARTTAFEPLIAIRPGYWRPAHFASAAASLDHLSGGRVRVNIVSGKDNLGAYGETESDQAHRYSRTKEFIQLVRKLWTEENVTYHGEHYQVTDSTVAPRITPRGDRLHPTLYFGGASEAAERVAATEADVQLFWGEPLEGVRERIERLRSLSEELGREHAPLEFGLRITTFVRDTTEQAWAEAEAKVAEMAKNQGAPPQNPHRETAVGQQRLLDLAARGDVLDDNLYTAPGKFGGGGAGTTWLVGSPDDVAESLRKYRDLGITHFVLSDTPYLPEIERQGNQLLPLLRE
ncbi:LLM class flavin-dependent oxidoreductase [Nocardia vinacea]|uniref:LLM class flavin-dependent oxidoreductase n=1 Tax=Nocardia vinacea TaxID=96468 RepID=UPI000308E4A7|nr:LLM class flavin-dependent oxidoreductase [Nocardia vinacea]